MENLHKNIQLILEFLKAPFLVLRFSCYTLMTFMTFSVLWLVDFNAGKTQLILFDQSNNNGSIDVKMDGSVLEEK